MAKQSTPSTPAAKTSTKTINRNRRNSLERKCLPKMLKVMFLNHTKTDTKTILAAWKESRKKVRESVST